MEEEVMLDISNRLTDHYSFFVDLMCCATPVFSQVVAKDLKKKEKEKVKEEKKIKKTSEPEPDSLDEEIERDENLHKAAPKGTGEIVAKIVQTSVISEREEIRKKYQDKLTALRQKRKQPATPESTPEIQQNKRQKRQEKKKTKSEKKSDQKKNKPQKKPQNQNSVPELPSQASSTKSSDENVMKKSKSEQNIQYSKIDFSSNAALPTQPKRKLSKQKLLQQAEKRRKKIRRFKGQVS